MGKRPSVQKAIETVTETKGFISYAADRLKISRVTLHAMINEHPTLKQAVIDAREKMKDAAEYKLLHNIESGKEVSLLFFLKTQARDRGYGDRYELTGKDGDAITIKVIKGVKLDDL